MARGISIHIGLNHVDERQYGGRFSLSGCLGDAHAMRDVAAAAGFEPRLITGAEATVGAVLTAIYEASARLGAGDILLITYSGHGDRGPDLSSNPFDGDEYDVWAESWCLYDRELYGDALYRCWGGFPVGARVVVVSDSCYSGDIIRSGWGAWAPLGPKEALHGNPSVSDVTPCALGDFDAEAPAVEPDATALAQRWVVRGCAPRRRALNNVASRRVYARNRLKYNDILMDWHATSYRPVQADVLLLSAAADHETAEDGEKNGAFTAALLEMWNGGRFVGSYVELHTALFRRLVPRQHPVLTALRPPSFARQRAFSI